MTMKIRLCAQMLTGMTIALGATANIAQPAYAGNKFFCTTGYNRTPTTYVRTSRGNEPLIRWKATDYPPPWTPQQRCEEVSLRFQKAYDNHALKYIRTGSINNQPVLCMAYREGESCRENQLIVTLKPGVTPEVILQQLRDFRTRVTGKAIELSDRSTKDVFFNFNGETYVNMQQILSEAQ